MKYLSISGIVILLLLSSQKLSAQTNVKTIYYLLDTAKIPIKDRMFSIESEGPAMFYTLNCKCVLYGDGIDFYYDIANKKQQKINKQEFSKIKTVSITELIVLALEHLNPEKRNRYQFVFAEPNGNNINLTEMKILIPEKPRSNTTETTIKPMNK